MDSFEDEMGATAVVHGEYLRRLLDAGFTRDEAFQLVRDHHSVFAWFAMVSGSEPPAWVGSPPASNPSSPSTATNLHVLKPSTPEA